MAKRMSRRQLALLFVVAVMAGIGLRYFFLPPGTVLSSTEQKLVGNWAIADQEEAQSWKFTDDRKVVVSVPGEPNELWAGSWRVEDDQLIVDVNDPMPMRIQFADTPDEFTLFIDGDQCIAQRIR